MADLLVNDVEPRAQYTAAAAQTVFAYPFAIFEAGDLLVYLTPAGQDADDDTDILALTADYTVSDAGETAGGDATLVTGATAGDIITIVRDVPVARTSDYQTAGDFKAETVNDDFDKLVMMVQQQEDSLAGRILKFLNTVNLTGVSTVFPAPVADGLLKWNSAANALQAVDLNTLDASLVVISTFMETLLNDGSAESGRTTLLIKDIHVGVAGGTVDAITSVCAPVVGTLYDGAIASLRAAGANTVTTPTFAPNGLTAKTIVKNGNQALQVGDIPRADYELILKYNSTNDNWELLNPLLARDTFVDEDDGSPHIEGAISFEPINVMAAATWESIGPTGSGADNILSSLNGIPSDVDWIEIRAMWRLEFNLGSAVGTNHHVVFHARKNGSSVSAGDENVVLQDVAFSIAAGGTKYQAGATTFKIPVNSRVFDLYYTNSFVYAGDSIGPLYMEIVGYGWNS